MNHIRRINIDLDTRDIRALIKCLRTLKNNDFDQDLKVHSSPSGNGFHVESWTTGQGLTKEELIKLRRKAGDDKIRCDLDSRSGRQIAVLFDEKTKTIIKNGDMKNG